MGRPERRADTSKQLLRDGGQPQPFAGFTHVRADQPRPNRWSRVVPHLAAEPLRQHLRPAALARDEHGFRRLRGAAGKPSAGAHAADLRAQPRGSPNLSPRVSAAPQLIAARKPALFANGPITAIWIGPERTSLATRLMSAAVTASTNATSSSIVCTAPITSCW